MRRILLALCLYGAALSACSQSLTGKQSGTGGTGTGGTGTGGTISGAGGAGGVASMTSGTGGAGGATSSPTDGGLKSVCADLIHKYAAAVDAAKLCTPGAAGQCGVLVRTELEVCATTMQVYANDSTGPDAVRQGWTDAGCAAGGGLGLGGFAGTIEPDGTVMCPVVGSQVPLSSACTVGDSGQPSCQTTYGPTAL
jgi:hypothetical protein